jgi:NAD(P)-dependent dehydrogenase (short-subunit alcohol dehydrogenase family)
MTHTEALRGDGRVAIVTGAGRGIGRGYALGLAEHGYRVVVADLDGDNAARVAEEVTGLGGEAIATTTDVSDVASATAMVDEAVRAFGTVHVLVNNAGLFGADIASFNPLTWDPVAGPLEQWDKVIAVNVNGVVYCSRAVAPIMRAQGWGRIVNQSSAGVYADIGTPYTISKLALSGVTRMFARALAKDGITVNALAPGLVASDAQYNRYASREEADEAMNAIAASGVPLGRPAQPSDLVGPLLFLASDASAYMTGHTMSVDGGWFSRV